MSDHDCCQVRMMVGLTVVLEVSFCPESMHPAFKRDLEARLLLTAAAASMAGVPWRVLWKDLREPSSRPMSQSGNPRGLPVAREQIILAAATGLRLMALDRPWLARLLDWPKQEAT
ncbi:MAG TPA: hypothetical protein VH136_18585 [Trebonia sp.]|jgi:hypothetical protein|nr:hypothetical protein [Trebonia sp.]